MRKEGFILIETMLAVITLALGIMSAGRLFSFALQTQKAAEEFSKAVKISEEYLFEKQVIGSFEEGILFIPEQVDPTMTIHAEAVLIDAVKYPQLYRIDMELKSKSVRIPPITFSVTLKQNQ